MIMRIVLCAAAVVVAELGFGEAGHAREQKRQLGGAPQISTPAPPETGGEDLEAHQKRLDAYRAKIKGMVAEQEKKRARELDDAQRTNPALYQYLKKLYGQQDAIDKILEEYRLERLSLTAARKQLTPLIRERVRERAATADEQIAASRATIQELTLIKDDPEAFIKREVELMVRERPDPKSVPADGQPVCGPKSRQTECAP